MIRYSKHNSIIHDKQNFIQIRIFLKILYCTKYTLVIGVHYGTIQNTPQTAVIVITDTRNHQTTYNLNHLEINIPRILQVGGTANARQTFFFSSTRYQINSNRRRRVLEGFSLYAAAAGHLQLWHRA